MYFKRKTESDGDLTNQGNFIESPALYIFKKLNRLNRLFNDYTVGSSQSFLLFSDGYFGLTNQDITTEQNLTFNLNSIK